MKQHHRQHRLLRVLEIEVIALALAMMVGCASSSSRHGAKTQATANGFSQPSSASDPCALRLHDLVGGLLLYYAQHNELPPNLKTLELPSGELTNDLVCPVSHQPYIYDPRGLPAPDEKSRLIIYDAVPAHGSFRWAVAITEPKPGQPLIAEVVAAPESIFTVTGKP
jgi:hypothetical protein